MNTAKISEVFFSIQGEGIFVGIPQVFIRFNKCNLDCRFCDTKLTKYKNYSSSLLLKKIQRFKKKYHSLCLTGGEPLCQSDFLRVFLPKIKKNKIKTYLETNGVLYKELDKIINYVDIISMDLKLPSSTGLHNYWNEHRKFLLKAKKREVFLKAIISKSTTKKDIIKAREFIRTIDSKISFVLQPNNYEISKELLKKTIRFQDILAIYLSDVRVIVQTHKIMGIR